MKKFTQKPFQVTLIEEGIYNRLYIKHPTFKGRIRIHLGVLPKDELENIQFHLKYDLENYFTENEISKEGVQEFVNQYVAMQVKNKASVFTFFNDFISYKKESKNKRTKKDLVKNTITSYITAGDYFQKYLEKERLTGHPSEINESVLDNFYYFVKGKHNYRCKLHCKVKAFIRYVDEVKKVRIDPSYKESTYTEEYDNMEPEEDDIALTTVQVKRLIELKHQIKTGVTDIQANGFTDKIPVELQALQFTMKRDNLIRSLDCFLYMISFGMYHSDIMKSKITIQNEGNVEYLKYRWAKNGSL